MRRWSVCLVATLLSFRTVGASAAAIDMEGARALLSTGHKDQARTALEHLVATGSREPDAYLFLGGMMRDAGAYDDAIRTFEQGLSVDPHHAGLRSELAMTLAWQKHFDRALREYDTVLKASPDDLGARLGRGRVLAWSGDYAASRAEFEGVLRVHPDNLEAMRGLGFVCLTRMEFAAARSYYERVLSSSPGDVEAREGLSNVEIATRWQLDAAGGFVHFNHSATFFAANAGLSYQINPEHRVDARYESNVSSSVVDVVTAPGAVDTNRAEFGWTARWNDVWTTELRYEPTLIGSDLWHRVAVRGAFRFVPAFVAVAGARPGIEQHGHREILADGGLQWLASDAVWFMAQDFVYVSDEQNFAYTVVGTGFWQMTRRFSARAGGGAGRTGSTPNSVAFGRVVLGVNDRWDLDLTYDYAHVTSVRHAAYLGAVARF